MSNLRFKLFKCSIANVVSLILLLAIFAVNICLEWTSNMQDTRALLLCFLNIVVFLTSHSYLVFLPTGKSKILPSQAVTTYTLNLEKPLYLPYNSSINLSDKSEYNLGNRYSLCLAIACLVIVWKSFLKIPVKYLRASE